MSDIKERLRNGVNIGSAEGFTTKAIKWSDAQEAADFIDTLEIRLDEEIERNEKLGLLAERLKAELAKHQWRTDMENVPKKTEILAYWEDLYLVLQKTDDGWWDCACDNEILNVDMNPTHWKPLDKPEE